MKLIKPSFEIWEQEPGIQGIYKAIERAGRVCYFPDTEVLTDSGWKRIDTLLLTDKVVSYNPDANTIIYDDPNLVINDYEDDMIVVDHPNIKMCITKDHRIYQSVPEKRDYTFLKASQLAGLEKIPHSKQCRFRIPKYFLEANRDMDIHFPDIVYSKEVNNGNGRSSVINVTIPCTLDFMVIAGAFISEGHTFHGESYGTGSYCQITQNESSELYDRVIVALTNLGWNYKVYSDPRKSQIKWIRFGTNQCWVMAFDDLFGKGSRNKHLPIWFRKLPDSYLETLISTMYLGDGSHNTTRHEKYLSISKRLLDEVQEVFILLGKNGTVNFDNNVSQLCYFEESHRDSWIISRDKHISTIPYKGKVYCTSTKSGIICIRYKGKTCWCGNCYKSEDKITEDSAKPFVDRMIKSGHGAMLEHGTVYLLVPFETHISKYKTNKYSKVRDIAKHLIDDKSAVTTNLRVLVENGWFDDLQYICEPTEFHEKRVCVHFTSDISTLREFFRHRTMSMAQESTRYCSYDRSKFGKELTFIIPLWTSLKEMSYSCKPDIIKKTPLNGYGPFEESFLAALMEAEDEYMFLLSQGWSPQQARAVLPLCTKSEAVMTGFVSDWEHFFKLRALGTTGIPHPQAKELSEPLFKEFKTKGLIK